MTDGKSMKLLKNSLLFQGLTESELREIDQQIILSVRSYEKEEIIVSQGGQAPGAGLIKKGIVLSVKYDLNGEEQLIRSYKAGEVICLDTLYSKTKNSPVTLICQSDCLISFLRFFNLFENRAISSAAKEKILHNTARILSDEHVKLIFKIDILSLYTLEERIMAYLRHVRERSDGDTFDIGMNQNQFAQFLYVNRSVLSTELNRMRREGLIDYSKSMFKIL